MEERSSEQIFNSIMEHCDSAIQHCDSTIKEIELLMVQFDEEDL